MGNRCIECGRVFDKTNRTIITSILAIQVLRKKSGSRMDLISSLSIWVGNFGSMKMVALISLMKKTSNKIKIKIKSLERRTK